ncbi:hypothetical protein GE061_012316 [Apolygus lucorum]|uniref:Uncharacterized protein n=1 Tax=Apolygus lucorum TaxID=248454 RepID=A0A6A4JII9_APOLU|nr:hypothetical protein GE061_012316 [Apolygus lucorum]
MSTGIKQYFAAGKRDRSPDGNNGDAKRKVSEWTMEEMMERMGSLMEAKLQPIQESVKNLATKEDLQIIQQENMILKEENEQLRSEVKQLKLSLRSQDDRLTVLENDLRRNNLVIGGLRVGPNGNIKQVVTDMFRELLGLETTPTLVAARMLGSPNAQNRPILVTLMGQDDKNEIIKRTSALRTTNIWISQDFTWEIREKRRILIGIRSIIKRRFPEQNVRVMFDKLVIGNERFWWDHVLGLVHRQGCGVEKIKETLDLDLADSIERLVQKNSERIGGDLASTRQRELEGEEQETPGPEP